MFTYSLGYIAMFCIIRAHILFTDPPVNILSVNVTKNIETLSIVVQWDVVDNSLPTSYTVTWTSESDGIQVATLIEQTSYTI